MGRGDDQSGRDAAGVSGDFRRRERDQDQRSIAPSPEPEPELEGYDPEAASMSRLTRMAEGIHDPRVAQDAQELRRHLRYIQAEAQALIDRLDRLNAERR